MITNSFILLLTEDNDPNSDPKDLPRAVHAMNEALGEGFVRVDQKGGPHFNASVFLFAGEIGEHTTLVGMARLVTDQDWMDEDGVCLIMFGQDELKFTMYEHAQLRELLP